MVWMEDEGQRASLGLLETMVILATLVCRVTKVTQALLEIPARLETRGCRATPARLAPQDPRVLMASLESLELLARKVELGRTEVLGLEGMMAFLDKM